MNEIWPELAPFPGQSREHGGRRSGVGYKLCRTMKRKSKKSVSNANCKIKSKVLHALVTWDDESGGDSHYLHVHCLKSDAPLQGELTCLCGTQEKCGLVKFDYLSGEWQLCCSHMTRITMLLSLLPGRDPTWKNFVCLHQGRKSSWTELNELIELNGGTWPPCHELNWNNWQPTRSGRRTERSLLKRLWTDLHHPDTTPHPGQAIKHRQQSASCLHPGDKHRVGGLCFL